MSKTISNIPKEKPNSKDFQLPITNEDSTKIGKNDNPESPSRYYMRNPLPIFEKNQKAEGVQSSDEVTVNHVIPSVDGFQAMQDLETKHRLKRFYAKNLGAKILWAYTGTLFGTLPEMSESRLRFHRTISCLRVRQSDVNVHMSREYRRAFYSGLCTCGNVWSCPVCAAKIQTRRRIEVLKFFNKIYHGKTKQVAMLTLTFPHSINDILDEVLKKLTEALEIFRAFNGSNFDDFKIANGYGGLIRALEITRGYNGWHPHLHELWILDYFEEDLEREGEIRTYLLNRWRHACITVGLLDPTNEKQMRDFEGRSLHLQFRVKDSEYIAKQNNDEDEAWQDKPKWGADTEICNSASKVGKKNGLTPFQILLLTEEKSQYKQLYVEYVLAMRGKAQMFWTPGLKLKCGIEEKTDEQLIAEMDDTADILAILEDIHWRCVVNNKFDGALLDLVESGGFEGLKQWFANKNIVLNAPDIDEEEVSEKLKEKQKRLEIEKKRNEKLKVKRLAKLEEDEKKAIEKRIKYDEKMVKRAEREERKRLKEEHQIGVAERRKIREQKKLETSTKK